MSWATQRPEDWQLGGKCETFLWGGGRHGQMCEAGRSAFTPVHAPSFSCAQQVTVLTFPSKAHSFSCILVELLSCCGGTVSR